MAETSLHDISIARFKSFFPDSPRVSYGDDFYVMDIKLSQQNQPLGHPCRFDGYMLLYCVKGRIRLNVNLTEYQINEGMIFMNVPGNIIRVNEILDVPKEEVQYVCGYRFTTIINSLLTIAVITSTEQFSIICTNKYLIRTIKKVFLIRIIHGFN